MQLNIDKASCAWYNTAKLRRNIHPKETVSCSTNRLIDRAIINDQLVLTCFYRL